MANKEGSPKSWGFIKNFTGVLVVADPELLPSPLQPIKLSANVNAE